MIDFDIPNMSCGHCVRAITEALKAADPAAQVEINLPTRRVQVTSHLPRADLVGVLAEAGYAPTPASA